MRATTLLNRVFDLPGVRVTGVDLGEVDGTGQVVVEVALRARLLACPACSFTTSRHYDRHDVDSSWRHLDLGGRVCRLRMRRRRLRCPTHGVVTQNVPFARPGARFTADFEDLVVWLVTRSDKTTVATFARVAWRTVGAMCERVAADVIDPHRLEGLVDIGVDEISWRKHHFSGDPKLSLVVSLGGDERGSCRSFCIACATWLPVRHTNLADPGEDATSRAQRDARVLDRR